MMQTISLNLSQVKSVLKIGISQLLIWKVS